MQVIDGGREKTALKTLEIVADTNPVRVFAISENEGGETMIHSSGLSNEAALAMLLMAQRLVLDDLYPEAE